MTVIDLARLLRRHWMALAIGLAIGVLLAGLYTLTRPQLYASSATGVVVAGDSLSVGNTMNGDSVTNQRSQMYAALGGTSAVAQRRNGLLAKMGRTGAESGAVSVTADATNGPFINVNAVASTPRDAQALASTTLSAVITEALRLETFAKTQGQGNYTDAQLSSMTTVHVLAYTPASIPNTPIRQHLSRNLGVGAIAGGVLAALLVLLRKAFDLKIRSQQDVEEVTGKSVLGIVPQSKSLSFRPGEQGGLVHGHAGEALRQLRTNLRFVNVDEPARSIVITSPAPGDGKSTIAAQLARIIAVSGEKVVLVDCDLRLPTQATRFGVDGDVGLTQVLTGDIDVIDMLAPTDVEGLWLLPAGRIPPNPSELLGSRAMRSIVQKLSVDHIVILDAPPLLAVTDAALLGAAVDGVVLVTRMGTTHKAQVALSAKLLEQAHAALLGCIVNQAPKRAMGEAMYGAYGYEGHEFRNYRNYHETAARTAEAAQAAHGAESRSGRRQQVSLASRWRRGK